MAKVLIMVVTQMKGAAKHAFMHSSHYMGFKKYIFSMLNIFNEKFTIF
jgi:hypothetical protein